MCIALKLWCTKKIDVSYGRFDAQQNWYMFASEKLLECTCFVRVFHKECPWVKPYWFACYKICLNLQ
jgi:hypothetical protein